MNEPLPTITAQELNDLIGTPDCPVIVDVRKRPAFDGSEQMIETAQWRNHEDAARWAVDLPQGKEVVVYCVHGHEVSQGAAAALLAQGVNALSHRRV